MKMIDIKDLWKRLNKLEEKWGSIKIIGAYKEFLDLTNYLNNKLR